MNERREKLRTPPSHPDEKKVQKEAERIARRLGMTAEEYVNGRFLPKLYKRLGKRYEDFRRKYQNVAVIEEGVTIGRNCQIYPQVYLGRGVTIGDNTTLYPGVKIYEGCSVGANCILHAGAVIGADGFGFMPNAEGGFDKIPQLGNVIIEDDVEIGANTCIDRAKTDSTIIRRGVKLDNLIQIGHNVQIGENTVSSAQTGIAGTSRVGRNCFLAGQVGIADHVTIGDRVKVGSKSGIDKNVGDDEIRLGYPALPGMQYHRSSAVFKNLPELVRRIQELEKQIKELQK